MNVQYNNKRKLNDQEEELIMNRIKGGEKYKDLAAEYNISMTTVSKIKKGRPIRDETMEYDQEPHNAKKLAEFYPLMNKRMLDWVSEAQKRNVRITSQMLQERAKIVAETIGWTTFRASSGWCVKFLRRNNIKLRELKKRALLKSQCQEATRWEDKVLRPRGDGLEGEEDDQMDGMDGHHMVGQEEEDFVGEEEDEERGLRGQRVPTLEGARKAWSYLQEWFISHPPHTDRVMQAIFVINKEMMAPSEININNNSSSNNTLGGLVQSGGLVGGGQGGVDQMVSLSNKLDLIHNNNPGNNAAASIPILNQGGGRPGVASINKIGNMAPQYY